MKPSSIAAALLYFISFQAVLLISVSLRSDASLVDNSVDDDGDDLPSIVEQVLLPYSDNEEKEQLAESSNNITNDPDYGSPTLDMIKREGYPAEAHLVTTSDGYILTLHRIPGPEGSIGVFLQHGFLSSSADWVISGKDKALPYLLADKGYDVWLGNARGNTYSRSHTNFSSDDSRFWNFSWHEMGLYDLPAALTYVAEQKSDTIMYIGHSMGTTMFYAMATKTPDITEKVRVMIGLAPVAFLNHLKSPIKFIAPFADEIELIEEVTGRDEFLPNSALLRFLSKYGCELDTLEENVCSNALFAFVGFDSEQFNNTLLPVLTSHTPAGTSTKTFVHYCQEIMSGHFREYDYGKEKNMEYYNSSAPPDYDLSSISVPIVILYADNDWLASPLDVQHLWELLPSAYKVDKYRVDFAKFNHIDFLYAIDGPKLVYRQVIEILNDYQ